VSSSFGRILDRVQKDERSASQRQKKGFRRKLYPQECGFSRILPRLEIAA
jgi:hypothetical protein